MAPYLQVVIGETALRMTAWRKRAWRIGNGPFSRVGDRTDSGCAREVRYPTVSTLAVVACCLR